MSSRHLLDPLHPSIGELLSDADPPQQGTVTMGDGSVRYIAPGSLNSEIGNEHVPLTRALSEGTAATHDQQTWGEFGASNQPSQHNKAGR